MKLMRVVPMTTITAMMVVAAVPAAAQQQGDIAFTAAQLSGTRTIGITEAVRIGGGEDTTKAGWIAGVAAGKKGELYVADQKHRHIS